MKNRIKNNILIIGIILGLLLVLVSIILASNSKKLATQEFYQNKKALEIERNYQNVDTGTYYEALEEALEAVESNQTIKVLNSITETIAPSLASGKTSVKLDMNGQTITLKNVALTNGGELDIYNSSATEGKLTSSGTRTIINSGTLTTNATSSANRLLIDNTTTTPTNRVIWNENGKIAILNANTYITFTNAIIQSETTAYRNLINNYGNLTIQGATLTNIETSTSYERGIYSASTARTIINSGVITTYGEAICNASTSKTTPGVEIFGAATETIITTEGSSVCIENNSTGIIKVNGGKITSKGSTLQNSKTGAIEITGGEIISSANNGIKNVSTGEINVTGGKILGATGIYNNSVGIINVSGSTTQVIGTTLQGIRGYIGEVTVTGGAINGKTDGIYITTENNISGIATITGGIVAGERYGVFVNGSSTLTVGEEDGVVSTIIPVIKSTGATEGNGIYQKTTAKFNFYDGAIVSQNGRASIIGEVLTQTGYSIAKTYDEATTTETSFLIQSNLLIPTKIEINKTFGKMNINSNLKLKATVYSGNYIVETNVIWSSNAPNIAKVNEKGTVTGVNTGECQITATTENGKIGTFNVEIVDRYDNLQKAIREVANAYYQRGINAQYCNWRISKKFAPEEATSQHAIYCDCTDYTLSVYYQAFEMLIQGGYASTNRIIAYGKKYYDSNNIKTNDIIEYWEKTTDERGNIIYKDNNGNVKDIDLSTAHGRQEYANKLLKDYNLQVGDILCYHPGGSTSGHAILVYDIIYDENGEPINAIIRESTASHEKKSTKLTKGLSYINDFNEINNVDEGTYRELYLINDYETSSITTRSSAIYNFQDRVYFTILRPFLKNEEGEYTGEYYFSTFKSQSDAPTAYICTGRSIRTYEMTTTTQNRINYSGIYIEKTVDVFNNSVVDLGDELEYTIKITNNGTKNYENLEIVEKISEYVDVIDMANGSLNGNKITWIKQNLEVGGSIELKYKVKVKNDYSLLQKEIISTGTVAGIPSSTVKNTISNNLKLNNKLLVNNEIQTIINSKQYSGLEMISKIYNEMFGININLENLDITDLVKTRDGITYYPENVANTPTIYLNKENSFSNMVLSNYYGATYTDSSETVSLKNWENTSYLGSRSERADTIYKENFKTGDVLVYKNTQIANSSVTYKTEDGLYYLIYISEDDKIIVDGQELYGFIGINENKEINHMATDYISMRTLLGKDYYVVLRPSMALYIEFEEYSEYIQINKKYLKNIQPNTTLEDFINSNKIKTNGNIEVFKNDAKITDNETKISTGMMLKISVNNESIEYTIVVKGDTNEDGDCDIKDILQANKHRLKKIQLTNENFLAGNLNENDEIDINDIMKINKFRLKKIQVI